MNDQSPRGAAALPALPARKPMASARRVSLFARQIHVRLSSAAVTLLFQGASVLSEGQFEAGGYYGSTMITIDCARVATLVSDPCDAATVRRMSELLAADYRVRERARHIGITEAERLAGAILADPQVDLRVRASGTHLHIDLDVEASASRARAK